MLSFKTLASISLLAALINCGPVFAETTQAGDDKPSSSMTRTPTAPDNDNSSLSGQVQLVEINLAVLRDLGLDIKRVHHGAATLVDEVSRQPVDLQTMPNVVGFSQVVNIPIGFTGGGFIAPRKSAVDGAMNSIEPWIDLAKASVDAIHEGHKKIDLDDATKEALAPQFKHWESLVNDTYNRLQTLKGLTKGPSYDNQSIADQAGAIAKDAKELDKVRRQVYKVLQREGKEASKKDKRKNARAEVSFVVVDTNEATAEAEEEMKKEAKQIRSQAHLSVVPSGKRPTKVGRG
jgi:hypothetical protein